MSYRVLIRHDGSAWYEVPWLIFVDGILVAASYTFRGAKREAKNYVKGLNAPAKTFKDGVTYELN